jgi:hypothetical protein
MYFLPLLSASPYYKKGRNTKFDWKRQAKHVVLSSQTLAGQDTGLSSKLQLHNDIPYQQYL